MENKHLEKFPLDLTEDFFFFFLNRCFFFPYKDQWKKMRLLLGFLFIHSTGKLVVLIEAISSLIMKATSGCGGICIFLTIINLEMNLENACTLIFRAKAF